MRSVTRRSCQSISVPLLVMLRALVPLVALLSLGLCAYEDNVVFTVFRVNSTGVNLASGEKLTDKNCSISEKLAIVSHGWLESIHSDWAKHLIGNLTEVRGGCVIFVDYSFVGNSSNYFSLLSHFARVSDVLTNRLIGFEREGFNPDDWFMFGHSAGARLVIDAAANFGYQRVKEIDGEEGEKPNERNSTSLSFQVCEPAGPGFDYRQSTKPPQSAAKNVQCIHTSVLAGTFHRSCHQDWMLGNCGRQQPASNVFMYYFCQMTRQCESSYHISHGLCPHYYNAAFKNDFVSSNVYNCGSLRPPTVRLDGYKMGYTESRKS